MANDSMKKESQQHEYIVEKGKIKAIVGGSALFSKGIKKGTKTSVDKHGVSGSWKDNMAGGGSNND